jgi:hypothetical protein
MTWYLKHVRAVIGLAAIPLAAGVAMSQSPTPSSPYPANDTPVTLPSGTIVRVRNIVVFVGPNGKSLTLYIETPTHAADSARVAREAKEVVDIHARSTTHGPFGRARVCICRTQACLELREEPREMFFFVPQSDGSWRAVAPPS